MRLLPLLLAALLLAGCASRPGGDGGPADPTAGPPSPPPPALFWQDHAPDPAPRYEIAAALSQGRIVTVAGLTSGVVPTSTVEAYDVAADAWSALPPYPVPSHHLAAVALEDGTVLAFGGWVGIGHSAVDAGFALAPGGAAWEPLPGMPRARGAHAAALHEGKVWLIGGTGLTGELLAEVDVYDPANGTWGAGPPLPTARDHLGAAVLDGRLYVAGGREMSLPSTTNETLVLEGDAWVPVAPMRERRGGFALAAYEGRLVAAGGEVDGATRLLSNAEAYDPAADAWVDLPPMAAPRTGNAAVAHEGRLYVVGGASPGGQPFSETPESLGPAA